jgi:hypothetical protein
MRRKKRGSPHHSPEPGRPGTGNVLVLPAVSRSDSSLMLASFAILSTGEMVHMYTIFQALRRQGVKKEAEERKPVDFLSTEESGQKIAGLLRQTVATESMPHRRVIGGR